VIQQHVSLVSTLLPVVVVYYVGTSCRHEALIQEVAELDSSVSALQEELNINVANLEDLRSMEAMLEEDFGIKKVTVKLESRCVKLRTYLAPNADKYVVNRMLEQDEFLDIMTR
jgi:hypothetical protein